MNVHDKRLQALTASYLAFNAAVSGASGGMKQFITNNQTINNTLNQTDNTLRGATVNITKMGAAASGAGNHFGGLLGTMLKYRAVSAVFEVVQKSISAVVTAMYDMEKQAARVQRVSLPGSTPGIRADIAVEAARTGADVKDVGEAYYQLKTQIKDNATAFSALNTAMNLHVGLEADARDTTRAMLQLYNQFGTQLGANVDQSEKMRRAGELLAIMWKGSDAEISDLISSLKYLGPIAEAAHVPLEQVAATISALTHEGVRGRMGGTEAGQLIGQIIKNFDQASGLIKNKGATLKAGLTPEGGLDIIQTMRNFNEVASQMPTATAMKFSQAISGTQNAWRLFGSVNPEFLHTIQEKLDDATKATHGLTHEADELRKTMTTTAQEGQRVFGGMFSYIANLVDVSPIRGWLHGIGDDLQHLLEAAKLVQQARGQLNDYYQHSFSPGAPVRQAVTDTQATVQQALANMREYRSGPVYAPGSPMEYGAVTADMTDAQRDMIRHRYLRSNSYGSEFDQRAMQRDIATMNTQLADPRFGVTAAVTPPSAPSASLGLRGLTRQQAENAAIIAEVARRHGIDPTALIAASYAESGLNARDVNPTSGATGLFQFLRSTRPDINRLDPRANAEAAAREITTAMSGHGAMPPGLTGGAAARWIIENFERPGPAGVRGDMSRVADFYRKHTIGGALGSYTDPADEKAQEEAARKQQEILDKRAKTAQIEYDHAKQIYGIGDPRLSAAATRADAASAAAGDADERLRLRYRLTGNVAGLADERKKSAEEADRKAEKAKEEADRAREEAAKEHAAATEYYAEKSRDKYGVFSPITRQRAQEAQTAAESAATGSPTDLMKLRDYATGPMKEFLDALREATDAIRERAKAAYDAAEAEREFGRGVREGFARQDMTEYERRAQSRQYALRPNMLAGGADARQEASLVADIADIRGTIKSMTRNATEEHLQVMRDKLEAANAALTDFHDTLDQKAYSKRVQSEQDAYELRNQEINHLHKLRFYKDEESAGRDTVRKLAELAASADLNLATVKGHPLTGNTEEEIRRARKDVAEAHQNLADYQIESRIQKYQNVYGDVKQTVHGAFMDFFHGKGDIGTVAERVGGSIVDAALEAQIKRFSDPLIQTVTSEILAIQGNTDALTLLNTTLGGAGGTGGNLAGGGIAGSVAVGVQAGMEDFGWGPVQTAGSGKAKGAGLGGGQSDLQKGAGAVLGAYSIGATAAQQGVNAGNFIGGVLAGAQIGSTFGPGGALIGGIIGGGIDLIGGLFHHKSTPTATPQDLNPAYYNAPSNFDVAAYNYSAYGKLPRVQDVGFDVKPANTPIVNVFVDGAKVAARQEITRQTTLATVSLTNANMDRHSPN